MLIQPILENAIKHGLIPKKEKGELKIAIFLASNDQKLCIEVTDNGVGRGENEANKSKNHISRGTAIVLKRLEMLNSKDKSENNLAIEDLKDEFGQAVGTKVTLFLTIFN